MKTIMPALAATVLAISISCNTGLKQDENQISAENSVVEYDTIISFDPETYEEQVIIVPRTIEEEVFIAPSGSAPPPPPPPAPKVEEIFKVQAPTFQTEDYSTIVENDYRAAHLYPLSTFSIDVDNASYSNARRFLNRGQLPPSDAVRIEEFINYFTYDYPQPGGKNPFAIYTEMADCPWNAEHKLVHLGLQGKNLDREELPPSNLVFLIDVSGSMDQPNKLPLLKSAFRLLAQQLGEKDRVAIVVYANTSGLVLPSTSGSDKKTILTAIDRLQAGGSTAGSAGIQLAYEIAQKNFLPKGNNRVILATDGDFNVGISSDAGLVELIEEKRQQDIFLSVLGFGTGNYKDNKMEQLADHGNGNYAYIDNMQEARKVFVNELTSTLFTIAKDVKIQIEFNPKYVKEYRLIGYENRLLRDEDFNNDTKDAGELGVGHTVTALYEIIPANSKESAATGVDKLRYQEDRKLNEKALKTLEWMTIKLRYKLPKAKKSKLIATSVEDQAAEWRDVSENFRFSAAVAGFGLLLRYSKYRGDVTFDKIADWALQAKGDDSYGYRMEFINLVKTAKALADEKNTAERK